MKEIQLYIPVLAAIINNNMCWIVYKEERGTANECKKNLRWKRQYDMDISIWKYCIAQINAKPLDIYVHLYMYIQNFFIHHYIDNYEEKKKAFIYMEIKKSVVIC